MVTMAAASRPASATTTTTITTNRPPQPAPSSSSSFFFETATQEFLRDKAFTLPDGSIGRRRRRSSSSSNSRRSRSSTPPPSSSYSTFPFQEKGSAAPAADDAQPPDVDVHVAVDGNHQPQQEQEQQKPMTRLCIFDFDSTLFRSPLPNPEVWASDLHGALISDCGWFTEPRTLSAPYVPEQPDLSWWDADVLADVRRAMREEEHSIRVLLTGRRHDLFYRRIRSLVDLADPSDPISFDMVFLKEVSDSAGARKFLTTLDYKLAVIANFLKCFPSLSHIEIWDDRKRHLDLFAKELSALCASGRLASYTLHHVIHTPDHEKRMPKDLEKQLVMDMVARSNARVIAAREREQAFQKLSTAMAAASSDPESAASDGTASPLEPSTPVVAEPESDYSLAQASSTSSALSSSSSSSSSRRPRVLPPLPTTTAPAGSSRPNAAPGMCRRGSASVFRSLLEPVEVTQYTALQLDSSSRAALLEAVSMPPSQRPVPIHRSASSNSTAPTVSSVVWSTRADHVMLCLGEATPAAIECLGGLGATVHLRAVAVGSVVNRVVAVKVELAHGAAAPEDDAVPARPLPVIPTPEGITPHATLYVAVGARSRDADTISSWHPLPEPVPLTSTLVAKRATGLKRLSSAPMKPKEVKLGDLVLKHHPQLKGPAVGRAIKAIEGWMAKTFMDNLAQNQASIELFVSRLDVSDPNNIKWG
ncbi:hypothetical protein DFJ73DRAFT_660541 [Zopfochytrium polystomum]|nr:hypothetical protein DFJ73DRAFT_660541 [Zopfochytrium polystomum]